jgi:hypothetical protein
LPGLPWPLLHRQIMMRRSRVVFPPDLEEMK